LTNHVKSFRKFESRFLYYAHPKNIETGTKNGTYAGPKPGQEGKFGGGVQITLP